MKKIARRRATEKSVGERGPERREPQSRRARKEATRELRAKSVSQPQQEPERESHSESQESKERESTTARQAREMEKQTSALIRPVNSLS